MTMKKSLIVVYSYHHNNTRKVADAMANVLGCSVKSPGEADCGEMPGYELAGFGAGIDSAKHYAPMLDFARRLTPAPGNKAFIFSTSAILGDNKVRKDHAALRDILVSKGYTIVGEFACKGYNTNKFLKYIGGINRGHPDEKDLRNAENFIRNLS